MDVFIQINIIKKKVPNSKENHEYINSSARRCLLLTCVTHHLKGKHLPALVTYKLHVGWNSDNPE